VALLLQLLIQGTGVSMSLVKVLQVNLQPLKRAQQPARQAGKEIASPVALHLQRNRLT